MIKKIISALIVVISSAVLASAGGVTNIKEVVNRSSKIIRLTTYEDKNDVESKWKTTRKIAAGAIWRGDMWIPWADNREQFLKHFLKIEIFSPRPKQNLSDVRVTMIYQSGEHVRTCPDNSYTEQNSDEINIELPLFEYNASAPRVAGVGRSGGDRRVIFSDNRDRSVGFIFEEFGR
ncbi:MAG: hypothetical protein H0U23_08530 [Blastocatellia bacterium]|nr:hypothetical protein [Blastocatellia bacterium]